MFLHNFLDYWGVTQPTAEFARQAGKQSISYSDALESVNQLANALINAGLQVGDRVAVLAKNRVEYIFLYFAASKAGVVPVPLNFRLSPPQWTDIINDALARVLISERELIDKIEPVRANLKYDGPRGDARLLL